MGMYVRIIVPVIFFFCCAMWRCGVRMLLDAVFGCVCRVGSVPMTRRGAAQSLAFHSYIYTLYLSISFTFNPSPSTTMSSFFSSLATKAQSAYEQSPISSQVSHLQAKLQKSSDQGGTGSAEQPSANQAASQGGVGAKSQVLGSITHQFRNLQMQYA